MSGHQRRAAHITADLETLALHGFVVTIMWTRPHQWSVFIKRAEDATHDLDAVDFHVHAAHLGEAVLGCMKHAGLA